MTLKRWIYLEEHDEEGEGLTLEEQYFGWHWCLDFDGLLVGPELIPEESKEENDTNEWQICSCFTEEEKKIFEDRIQKLKEELEKEK